MTASSGSSPDATTAAPWIAPRHSRSTFIRCRASAFGSSGSATAAQAAASGAPAGEAAAISFPSSSASRS